MSKKESPKAEAIYVVSRTVAAALNIGDADKVDSFISKIEKKTATKISTAEQNIKIIEFNLAIELDKLNEDLEDAKAAVKESYSAIDLEKIKTHQAQNEYISVYLKNIEEMKHSVKVVELLIEHAKTKAQDNIKDFEDEIKEAKETVLEVTKKA